MLNKLSEWNISMTHNFIVVQNSYVQGKSGNQLKFESLLTLSEIYSKYPHKHVKLGKIIWKNNKRLALPLKYESNNILFP